MAVNNRDGSRKRSAADVLESHIEYRQQGRLEEDLLENYSDQVVVLTMEGVYRGHDGIRETAAKLRGYLGPATFAFPTKWVVDRFAFIEWRANDGDRQTRDGSDSFVIENGRIVCQTIRYTVRK